jgi:hypothetical protein
MICQTRDSLCLDRRRLAVNREEEHIRHLYAGREIDPVEAASIHIALQELQERVNSYLEIEVAEDDTAERIECNCRAIAEEMRMRLLFTVIATRVVRNSAGRVENEPSLLQVSLDRTHN